jgi:hypothetical protein
MREKGQKWTYDHLPVGCHDDGRFRKIFIPTYIHWCSMQKTPFSIPDDDALKALQIIWNLVYGMYLLYTIKINGPVFAIVRTIYNYLPYDSDSGDTDCCSKAQQRACDTWRNPIGSSGISVVNAFFEVNKDGKDMKTDKARKAFANDLLQDFKFLFSNTKSADPEASDYFINRL